MTTEADYTLPLQCFNEKCLYYEDKNCNLEAYRALGNVERKVHNSDQMVHELPLEFSFEADSLGDDTVCYSASKFFMHQSNEPIMPNYIARNFTSIYPKNEQSNCKDFIDYRYIRKIQYRDDHIYYNTSIPTYPPCFGPEPWDYGYCYGTNGSEPCQFSGVVDMEDFM